MVHQIAVASEAAIAGELPAMELSPAGEYDIPCQSRHVFSTNQRLVEFLEERYGTLVAGQANSSHYVAADHVTPQVLQWVDQNRRSLPPSRIQYSQADEVLIWKFATTGHDSASMGFHETFREACSAAGITRFQLAGIGSGRIQNLGRAKEPDQGYKPANTRSGTHERPTVVLEVGYSESLAQLRVDAHHWLTKTDQEVRIGIVLHINTPHKRIRIERWELTSRLRPRGQNAYQPTLMQSLELSVSAAGIPMVSGAPLVLSVDKLFDQRPAQVSARDVTITRQDLETFILSYFAINT